jgi:amino acid transporter
MKRTILIYGLILGTILSINMFFVVRLFYTSPDFESNDFVGYSAMVLVFSLVFFGVRNYRNKQLDGVISFGKALKTGIIITLIASTLYVIVWLFYYYLFVPDFIDKFVPHVLKETARKGATPTELAETAKQMEQYREMYKSPFFVVLLTYAEVVPVGLVVALISSFILKRKQKKEIKRLAED